MAGRHRKIGRKTVALGAIIAGLLAAGIAFAAWTATGTGSGYAKATNPQELTTVDVSATTTATLYPGGTGDVELRISNPNAYPVQVADVAGDGAITADVQGCNATSVSFTDQTGLSIDVPADDVADATLTGAVSMDGTAVDACQGAVFTIPVSLSGTSTTP